MARNKIVEADGRDSCKNTGLKMLALTFIFITLLIPNRLGSISPSAFDRFPLEALFLGLILLVPGRLGLAFRGLAALVLAAGILCKIADICTYQVFGRPFNPVLDANFPRDGMNFLQGALGRFGALLAAVLLAALPAGIVVLAYMALGQAQALWRVRPKVRDSVLLAGMLIWTASSFAGWLKTSTPFYELMARHASDASASLADLEAFNAAAALDPSVVMPDSSLFDKLKGKDVLVVFIESYGRTVLDKADFAAHVRPLLEQSSANLAAKGFLARSAYLTSPTYGGISWLAHGTLLSGLWIDSQTRYDRLVLSERQSLNRLFKRAGWRTVAVQPAHTMDWPQGKYFGYDRIYAAKDLGYRGQPFNWITMPDQYTLSAFQSLERKPAVRTPVMAEIALLSSHAPWTPLPLLVDWNQVGDGAIFNRQARVGDEPEAVWRNTGRIREQYRKSIEYALATIVSYVINHGGDNLVILALGDHQPAPFVTGESESREVPVHLISRDAKVMAAVQGWQWTEGMLPAGNAPVWGMDSVRERLIAAFSAPTPGFANLRAPR